MIDFKNTVASHRVSLALALAAVAASTGSIASGQAPLLDHARFHDPKLLPPCAAEGSCRPNHATTGFYQTRWRQWPGEAAAVSSEAESDESALPGLEPIDPKLEDREAPEPSESVEAEDDAPPSGGSLPSLPPLPPLPGQAPEAEPDSGQEGGEQRRLPPFQPLRRGASTTPLSEGERLGSVPPRFNKQRPASTVLRSRAAEEAHRNPERALDTPPPLPANLPRVNNVAWVISGDSPPVLPWRLDTAAESAVIKANAAKKPSATPPVRRLPAVPRFDTAVRPTAVHPAPTIYGSRQRR